MPCWSQQAPIEIDLVPPPAAIDIPIQLTPSVVSRPTWEAPRNRCALCGEVPREADCGCSRPLTQRLAEQLLGQVYREAETTFAGKLRLPVPVEVKVVSAARLRQLGGEPVLGLYQDGVIWLSMRLNRRRAFAVLGHEYGHAWQYARHPDVNSVPELLFEGFAEWVSYKLVVGLSDHKSTRAVREDSSVYGRGARHYLEVESEGGLEAVLREALSR